MKTSGIKKKTIKIIATKKQKNEKGSQKENKRTDKSLEGKILRWIIQLFLRIEATQFSLNK